MADETPLQIEYDYDSGLVIFLNGIPVKLPGQVIEEVRNENNQLVYEFGNPGADSRASGHVTMSWNGQCNVAGNCQVGEYVPEGTYKFYIKSTNNNNWNTATTYTSGNISLRYTQPFILSQKDPAPPSVYSPGTDDPFTFTYTFEKGDGDNKGSSTFILTIKGPGVETEIQEKHSGAQILFDYPSVSWEGMINGAIAPEGDYEYSAILKATAGGYEFESDAVTGKFKVQYQSPEPSPSPNPPSPSTAPPSPAPSPTPVPPSPSPSPVTCGGFGDVKFADCEVVEYVKSIGAMTGYANGDFGPDNELNRAEIAKIVEVTFKKFVEGTDYCLGVNPFPDVPSTLWAYHYICRGKNLGMITGYLSGPDQGFYRPSRNVNRAEFLALVLRNLSDTMVNGTSYYDVSANDWFNKYAKFSYDQKLFEGTRLYPHLPTKRIEVARALFRLHELGKI